MKPILITLATSATLAIGAVTLVPERTKPITITPVKPEKPKQIALPAQAVQGYMQSKGVNHSNSPHVYQLLVNEEPPTVDISQVSPKDIANEYKALLEESDVNTALNGMSANDILIEKATIGIAKEKMKDNFVND